MADIVLKDGSKTKDRRLDRLIHFDERSRKFPIRAAIKAKAPRSYTWRCREWLDQGNEGACVGFAVSHELIARPAESPDIDNNFARVVYHSAQMIDEWPGGSYPDADPFYEGTSVLAGVKVLQQMRYFDSYRWAFGVQDLLMGVAYSGPAVLGTYWYDGMFDTDEHGFVHVSGDPAGGHAYIVRGARIDDAVRVFFLGRNSWGRDWGVDGDFWITYEDMGYLLKQDGEACFFVGRHKRPK